MESKGETTAAYSNSKECLNNQTVRYTDNQTVQCADNQEISVGNISHQEKYDSSLRGWVICFTSFLVNGTVFGIQNTFGILFAAMMHEYGDEDDKEIAFRLSWIGSINLGLFYLMSPFSSFIIQTCGIRKAGVFGAILGASGLLSSSFVGLPEILYVTFGVCVGIGSSLVFIGSISILGHYFDKRIGLANGIAWSGGALCTIALTFLLKYGLKFYGFKWTLRFLSVLFASLIICSLSWKPQIRKPSSDSQTDNKLITKLCNKTIWRNNIFIVWVVAMSIGFTGYLVAEIHLVQHSKDKFPKSNAELLIIGLAITSFFSRIITGRLTDIPKLNCVIMLLITMLALGICNACIPSADTFITLMCVVIFMGIFDGSFMGMQSFMAYDLLGPELAGQGTGYLLGIGSIPSVIGPPMAGLAYDYTNNYTVSFLGAGVILILSSFILFIAVYIKRAETKSSEAKTTLETTIS